MSLFETELLTLLRTRRSSPPITLAGPGPDAAQVADMLAIAARVPDHGKLAPWRFILFEGAAQDRAGEEIEAVFRIDNPAADEARLAIERRRLSHAPLVVGIVSRAGPHVKVPEWEQVLSAGAVCYNLILAAKGHGFAATWLTEWHSYDRRVMERFGLAAHERMAGFVHIGRATIAPEDRVRPVLADITSRYTGAPTHGDAQQ